MKSRYLLLFIFSALVFASCGKRIKGNGNVTEVHHDLDQFTSVDIGGMYEVVLIQQKGAHHLEVVTDENIHDHIEVSSSHGELSISNDGKYFDVEELRLMIYFDALEELDMSGAVEIYTKDGLKGESLLIDISGAGSGDLDLDLKELDIEISGGGELNLKGEAEYLNFEVSGAGEVNAFDLMTRIAEIDVTGAGNVEISVQDELDVSITGAGDVKYIGSPEVSKSITGAGDIKQVKGW